MFINACTLTLYVLSSASVQLSSIQRVSVCVCVFISECLWICVFIWNAFYAPTKSNSHWCWLRVLIQFTSGRRSGDRLLADARFRWWLCLSVCLYLYRCKFFNNLVGLCEIDSRPLHALQPANTAHYLYQFMSSLTSLPEILATTHTIGDLATSESMRNSKLQPKFYLFIQ